MCFDCGNINLVFNFINSMMTIIIGNFGAGKWDLFVVYKIVCEIMDMHFNSSTI